VIGKIGKGLIVFTKISGADHFLKIATTVLNAQDPGLLHLLDDMPAPLYATDADGFVTYFNKACIGFAGRTPEMGKDRWCVTWKLFTDTGEPLPHEECPMAGAIRNKRTMRGLTAVAERPDGTRVPFMPFPTPLFSDSGEFLGAINILIDISEREQAGDLRQQAARCRRLAGATGDEQALLALGRMAIEYEIKASALDLMMPQ
jgi:PAS domain S-box-containing protein